MGAACRTRWLHHRSDRGRWGADDELGRGPDRVRFDVVSFEVCLDTSGLVNLDEAGEELDQQPQDAPYLATVTVMGQPDSELGWSFTEYAEDVDAPC